MITFIWPEITKKGCIIPVLHKNAQGNKVLAKHVKVPNTSCYDLPEDKVQECLDHQKALVEKMDMSPLRSKYWNYNLFNNPECRDPNKNLQNILDSLQ